MVNRVFYVGALATDGLKFLSDSLAGVAAHVAPNNPMTLPCFKRRGWLSGRALGVFQALFVLLLFLLLLRLFWFHQVVERGNQRRINTDSPMATSMSTDPLGILAAQTQ